MLLLGYRSRLDEIADDKRIARQAFNDHEEEAKNGNIVGNKSRDAYLLVVSARRLHRGRKNCPGSTAPFEISGQLHREVSRRSIETESSSCM